MKTLSIRPPWCFAILNLGKRIENRRWETPYRGPLLIHAGKQLSRDDYECVARHCRRLGVMMPEKKQLQAGGIVARCNLVDIVTECDDEHYFVDGLYAWVLEEVEPVPFYPINGKLKLYETPWPL